MNPTAVIATILTSILSLWLWILILDKTIEWIIDYTYSTGMVIYLAVVIVISYILIKFNDLVYNSLNKEEEDDN